MARIVFINAFDSARISGGIKSTYQHAELLTGLIRGDPGMVKMREAGRATAARYTRERTKAALRQVYGALQRPPG